MKKQFATPAREFRASSHFYIRSPLLAFSEVEKFLRENLKVLKPLGNPVIHEAIEVAAPGFLQKLLSRSEDSALLEKLAKYIIRLGGRPMAFGLFAGVSPGQIGSKNEVIFKETGEHTVFTTLDQSAETTLMNELLNNPKSFGDLQFCLNPACELRDSTVFLATQTVLGSRKIEARTYDLLPKARAFLDWMRLPRTGDEILTYYKLSPTDANHSQFRKWFQYLLDQRLLMTQFDQNWRTFEKWKTNHPLQVALKEGSKSLLSEPHRRRHLKQKVNEYLKLDPQAPSLYMDLVKATESCELNQKTIEKIVRGTMLLKDLFKGRACLNQAGNKLELFKNEFEGRYNGKEVSLSKALQLFRDPLIQMGESESRFDSPIDSQLLDWMLESDAFHSQRFSLTPEHIEKIKQMDGALFPEYELPTSLTTTALLIQEDRMKVYIPYSLGSPVMRQLSRYAFPGGPVREWALELAREESKLLPQRIFAEIQFFPEPSKSRNIVYLNGVYDAILPVHCFPRPQHPKIALEDIKVSVENNKVRLRSESLNREIIPVLPNLYNFSLAQNPTLDFLAQIIKQNSFGYLGWVWGQLSDIHFLPRVEYKDFILCPASWRLGPQHKTKLRSAKSAQEALQILQKELRLPRYILWIDGEQKLPLDLENPAMMTVLLNGLRGQDVTTIEEWLNNPDTLKSECFVKDREGRPHLFEVILPMVRTALDSNPPRTQSSITEGDREKERRTCFHGFDCLYYKLFLDQEEVAHLLVDDLLKLGVDQTDFFFIRYSDPKFHLRLRFLGSQKKLSPIRMKIEKACKNWLMTGKIYRYSMENYDREFEKYGNLQGCRLFETFSIVDTRRILKLLKGRSSLIPKSDWSFVYGVLSALYFFDLFSSHLKKEMQSSEMNPKLLFAPQWLRDRCEEEVARMFRKYREHLLDPKSSPLPWIREVAHVFSDPKLVSTDQATMMKLVQWADGRHEGSLDRYLENMIHLAFNRGCLDLSSQHEPFVYQKVLSIRKSLNIVKSLKGRPR
jgi:thiopeptide-type bacteriocin biosynthesis protein